MARTGRPRAQARPAARRAALYARCSTQDQHADAQLWPLQEYAERRGLEARIFVDHGVSGARDRRPALDKMMAAVRRREVDLLVIQKLDRLARSVAHLTALAQELDALGVDLVVVDQDLNTATPAGKLLFHVLGAIAEFERDLIRERTRAGLEAARRRGKQIGRPRSLDDHQVERARRLAARGRSLREIAAVLGASRSAVHRALQGAS